MTRAIVVVLLGVVLGLGQTNGVEAKDLAQGLVDATDIRLDVRPSGAVPVLHEAHFTSDAAATFGLLVKQLASSAADFPAISTVPGFTFHYNPQLQIFERSSASLGPVFVERPQTLGAGKFDLGVSYLAVDFKDLNGKSLERLKFRGLGHNDCCSATDPPPSQGRPPFENDTADLFFEEFELRSHVVSFFGTYGITDRWDVNLLVPVVFTSFFIETRQRLNNESNLHFFDVATQQTERFTRFDDDKVGVGDIQLRTKYHLYGGEGFNFSAGSTLRVPSGDEDNFQGLGDTTLTPFLSLAQEFGRFDFHDSSGLEFNFDDSDRSRVRYAGGVALGLIEQVALLVDVVGSSGLKQDRISQRVKQFINSPGTSEGTPIRTPVSTIVHDKLRTDIVDLNVGFKVSPFGTQRSAVAFATVFIPLNDDGLRADFIPAVGVEVGF